MYNFRQVDKQFFLSGGWQNLPEDVKFLEENRIEAVLDLQFTPADDETAPAGVNAALATVGIDFAYLTMYDVTLFGTDMGYDIEDAFIKGIKVLTEFAEKYDRVLVKCGVGMSRSPAMLAAYLCDSNKSANYDEAIAYIRKHEPATVDMKADPSPRFRDILRKVYGGTYVQRR